MERVLRELTQPSSAVVAGRVLCSEDTISDLCRAYGTLAAVGSAE